MGSPAGSTERKSDSINRNTFKQKQKIVTVKKTKTPKKSLPGHASSRGIPTPPSFSCLPLRAPRWLLHVICPEILVVVSREEWCVSPPPLELGAHASACEAPLLCVAVPPGLTAVPGHCSEGADHCSPSSNP